MVSRVIVRYYRYIGKSTRLDPNKRKIPTTLITIGKTTYTVERATEADDTFYMTGPRGALSIVVPFSNNADKYHAFRFSGTHADLKNTDGTLWTISRTELEAAAAELATV